MFTEAISLLNKDHVLQSRKAILGTFQSERFHDHLLFLIKLLYKIEKSVQTKELILFFAENVVVFLKKHISLQMEKVTFAN